LAFNLQTKYVIAILKPKTEGSSTFENYHSEFNIEGNPVPAMKNGNNILIYVPFHESQGDTVQHVTYTLRHMHPTHRPPLLLASLTAEFQIALKDAQVSLGGYDFPTLRLTPVDMISHEVSKENAKSAVSEESAELRGLKPAPGAVPPTKTEPA